MLRRTELLLRKPAGELVRTRISRAAARIDKNGEWTSRRGYRDDPVSKLRGALWPELGEGALSQTRQHTF